MAAGAFWPPDQFEWLARLLVALRLPSGEQNDTSSPVRRPQRRSIRGVYRMPSLA